MRTQPAKVLFREPQRFWHLLLLLQLLVQYRFWSQQVPGSERISSRGWWESRTRSPWGQNLHSPNTCTELFCGTRFSKHRQCLGACAKLYSKDFGLKTEKFLIRPEQQRKTSEPHFLRNKRPAATARERGTARARSHDDVIVDMQPLTQQMQHKNDG